MGHAQADLQHPSHNNTGKAVTMTTMCLRMQMTLSASEWPACIGITKRGYNIKGAYNMHMVQRWGRRIGRAAVRVACEKVIARIDLLRCDGIQC